MCKYCKNLKRIKDLQEKKYLSLIKAWQRESSRARKLIERVQLMILSCQIQPYDSDELYTGDVELYDDLERYLKKDWIRR